MRTIDGDAKSIRGMLGGSKFASLLLARGLPNVVTRPLNRMLGNCGTRYGSWHGRAGTPRQTRHEGHVSRSRSSVLT